MKANQLNLVPNKSATQVASFIKLHKCILSVLLSFVFGNVFAQTVASTSFENNSVGSWKGGGSTETIAIENAITRTGGSALKLTTTSNSQNKQWYSISPTMATSTSLPYVHIIYWAKGNGVATSVDASTRYASSQGLEAEDIAINNGNWTRVSSSTYYKGARDYFLAPKRSAASALSFYLDDIVIYASENATPDIIKPTSATSATGSINNPLSWTNGSDIGTDATGIKSTLIFKRTSGVVGVKDLSLNDQALYSLSTSEGTKVVGNWTLVDASVLPTATSYMPSANDKSSEYAIVHRDLAYNYSEPTYVSIKPAVYNLSGTAVICTGTNTTLNLSSSEANVSYQLYKDGVVSGSSIAGTGAALIWSVTAAGVYTVKTIAITLYPTVDMNGSASITVNELPVITTQPVSTSVNQNATATLSLVATGTALTYQWYSSANADGSSASPISGATNASFDTPTSVAGTIYYYCEVSGACTPKATSSIVSVLVIDNTPVACAPTGCNLVANGDFQVSTANKFLDGEVCSWYISNNNSGQLRNVFNTDKSNYSAQVESGPENPLGGGIYTLVSTKKGSEYILSFTLRTEKTALLKVFMINQDGSKQELFQYKGASGWHVESVKFVSQYDAVKLQFESYSDLSNYDSDAILIDDVSLSNSNCDANSACLPSGCNLIANGGFETLVNGLPCNYGFTEARKGMNWNTYKADPQNVFQLDMSSNYKIVSINGNSYIQNTGDQDLYVKAKTSLLPNKKYKFSVDVDAFRTNIVLILASSKTGHAVSIYDDALPFTSKHPCYGCGDITPDWTKFTIDNISVSEEYDLLFFGSTFDDQTIFFDNLSIEEVGCTVPVPAACTPTDCSNLVPNSNFETFTGAFNGENALCGWTKDEATSDLNENGANHYLMLKGGIATTTVDVQPGTYNLMFYIKTWNNTKLHIYLKSSSGNTKLIYSQENNDCDWSWISVPEFTITEAFNQLLIDVSGNGDINIDDIILKKTDCTKLNSCNLTDDPAFASEGLVNDGNTQNDNTVSLLNINPTKTYSVRFEGNFAVNSVVQLRVTLKSSNSSSTMLIYSKDVTTSTGWQNFEIPFVKPDIAYDLMSFEVINNGGTFSFKNVYFEDYACRQLNDINRDPCELVSNGKFDIYVNGPSQQLSQGKVYNWYSLNNDGFLTDSPVGDGKYLLVVATGAYTPVSIKKGTKVNFSLAFSSYASSILNVYLANDLNEKQLIYQYRGASTWHSYATQGIIATSDFTRLVFETGKVGENDDVNIDNVSLTKASCNQTLACTPKGCNLIANGDFQTFLDKTPCGWAAVEATSLIDPFAYDEVSSHTTNGFQYENNGNVYFDVPENGYLKSSVNIIKENTYKIKFDYFGGNRLFYVYAASSKTGQYSKIFESKESDTTSNWRTMELNNIKFDLDYDLIFIGSPGSDLDLNFDNISIEEVGCSENSPSVYQYDPSKPLCIEAEKMSELSNFAPMQTYFDAKASSTGYIMAPTSLVTDATRLAEMRAKAQANGHAIYNINVPVATTVYMWFRTICPNGASDSYWISLDGGAFKQWSPEVAGKSNDTFLDWTWTRASIASGSVGIPLSVGVHKIEIAYREPGTQLDKIYLTASATDTPEALACGEKLPPIYQFSANTLCMEAEDMSESSNMSPVAVATDIKASLGQYIMAASGEVNLTATEPLSVGHVSYYFDLPADKVFYPWLRTICSDKYSDSFWYRFDNGPFIKWSPDVPGSKNDTFSVWTWTRLSNTAVSLTKGTHKLEIAYRELNAKLDKIYFATTNTDIPVAYGCDDADPKKCLPQGCNLVANSGFECSALRPVRWTLNGDGELGTEKASPPNFFVPRENTYIEIDQNTELFQSIDILEGRYSLSFNVFDNSKIDVYLKTVSGILEPLLSNKKVNSNGDYVYCTFTASEPYVGLVFKNTSSGDIKLDNISIKSLDCKSASIFECIEAESPYDKSQMSPFVILSEPNTSGYGYLLANSKDAYYKEYEHPNEGRVKYKFTTNESDSVVIWLRAKCPSDEDDSYSIRFDNGKLVPITPKKTDRFNFSKTFSTWSWRVWGVNYGRGVKFYLPKGEHVMELVCRENGTKVDKFIITNDFTYVPVGYGCDNYSPSQCQATTCDNLVPNGNFEIFEDKYNGDNILCGWIKNTATTDLNYTGNDHYLTIKGDKAVTKVNVTPGKYRLNFYADTEISTELHIYLKSTSTGHIKTIYKRKGIESIFKWIARPSFTISESYDELVVEETTGNDEIDIDDITLKKLDCTSTYTPTCNLFPPLSTPISLNREKHQTNQKFTRNKAYYLTFKARFSIGDLINENAHGVVYLQSSTTSLKQEIYRVTAKTLIDWHTVEIPYFVANDSYDMIVFEEEASNAEFSFKDVELKEFVCQNNIPTDACEYVSNGKFDITSPSSSYASLSNSQVYSWEPIGSDGGVVILSADKYLNVGGKGTLTNIDIPSSTNLRFNMKIKSEKNAKLKVYLKNEEGVNQLIYQMQGASEWHTINVDKIFSITDYSMLTFELEESSSGYDEVFIDNVSLKNTSCLDNNTCEPQGCNLLANGDFESWKNNEICNWVTLQNGLGSPSTWELDNPNRSLFEKESNGNNYINLNDERAIRATILPLHPNKKYTLTFDFDYSNHYSQTPNLVQIYLVSSKSGSVKQIFRGFLNCTSTTTLTWHAFSLDNITVEEEFDQLYISNYFEHWGYYLDNIVLKESDCGKPELRNPTCKNCIASFAPTPGEEYVISAWAKETSSSSGYNPQTYTNATISLYFNGSQDEFLSIKPSGSIIDGWQRIDYKFTIPQDALDINIKLNNESSNNNIDVFFDDIRIQPSKSSMKSYVYDPVTLKLSAELDERNYATFYEYDEEGNLIRVKKETERGVKTIQESFTNISKKNR